MNETSSARLAVDPATLAALTPLQLADGDGDVELSLPNDFPQWQRDVVTISSRARAAIAAIVPHVIRVLTFWDHRIRELAFGSRTLGVDAAGCYRLR